jgi:hypothetical protein
MKLRRDIEKFIRLIMGSDRNHEHRQRGKILVIYSPAPWSF